MEMRSAYKVRVSIAFALALLCFDALASSRTEPAKSLYENALKLESDLKSSQKLQRDLSNWKRVVSTFQSVYYKYPSSGYCDNALFHVGNLYAEMAQRFSDPLYYRRACSSYQFLIDQYSSSSLMQDAMLEYIRITRNELKKEEDATIMEARLRAHNPKSILPSELKSGVASKTLPVMPAVLTRL